MTLSLHLNRFAYGPLDSKTYKTSMAQDLYIDVKTLKGKIEMRAKLNYGRGKSVFIGQIDANEIVNFLSGNIDYLDVSSEQVIDLCLKLLTKFKQQKESENSTT